MNSTTKNGNNTKGFLGGLLGAFLGNSTPAQAPSNSGTAQAPVPAATGVEMRGGRRRRATRHKKSKSRKHKKTHRGRKH